MTDLEAIGARASRRSYLDARMDVSQADALKQRVSELNDRSGLTIAWIEDGGRAFDTIGKSYGMFKNVRSLIALKGPEASPHLQEKAGYYGEMLVLMATKLGLGSCWVGGTMDRGSGALGIAAGEALVCAVTVGPVAQAHSIKERAIRGMTHLKTKRVEELFEADGPVPEWFVAGIRAVQRAPSAINSQKARFRYLGGRVSAGVPETSPFDLVDLGIAKLHFELAADGRFDWGNHGVYHATGCRA